ncbi:MAG: hypothetical protein ACYC8T_16305 [Myxococcaceae bacterium]
MTSKSSLRKRVGMRPALTLVVTIGTAATLGVVVYLASTSLPFLATSPTTDPVFGELNQCLIDAVGAPRVGFAVSPDGAQAAAYGGATLAVCTRSPPSPDGGTRALARAVPLEGITGAAFDFGGTLWLSTERKGEGDPKLWRLRDGAPVRVGDFAPVALAGHARGAAALDASGRVVSLSAEGEALGVAQLPSPPTFGAQLATNSDGTLLAVAAGTGLFVYRAADLSPVFAEGLCEVEFLWWRREPGRALVSCGPQASWALELQVLTGEREAAPAMARVQSTLLPTLGGYVQGCEHLPCSAPAP